MTSLRSDIPRIFVYLMNAYSSHRAILHGVFDYMRGHTPWSLELNTGRRDEISLNAVDWSAYDGVLVNGMTPELLAHIRNRGLPAMYVCPQRQPDVPCGQLYCDNQPIGTAAVRFMLSRDFASYAFVDIPGIPWARQRGDLFCTGVAAAHLPCLRWRTTTLKALAQQIAQAPKPLGVFAADDIRARMTLDACRLANCPVPDTVAVLGVDNDPTFCEFASPSLSSIPTSSHTAGFRAAEILDGVLQGTFTPTTMPDAVYTGDTIVERQSTARVFTSDPLVRRCSALIAANFTSPLPTNALAQALHVSRRTLETRFQKATHTTIAAEVLRLRVERARSLLTDTTQSQEQIALACGFYDASHLGATFRKQFDKPPSAFRAPR